jgi:hypothetical protein
VFYKQLYNPNKGTSIALDENISSQVEELMRNEAGLDPLEIKSVVADMMENGTTLGDTDILLRNPFDVYPQPGKRSLEEMTIFGDSEYLTKEEIYEKYGVLVDEEYTKDKTNTVYTVSVNDVLDISEFNIQKDQELLEVRELYILPNKVFKEGANYKWVGNTFIDEVKPCDDIPISHIGFIRMPGNFWFKDLVSDLIPMQIRWNELLSKIEMHNDLYNDPPIIIDPNVIDIDDWVVEPGLILEKKLTGTGGDEPWVMKVPTLDQSIFTELNLLDKQFEIVPVMNKVSFGKDTPNARSGLAINYLQEKDDDVVRPLIEEIEIGYSKVFKRDYILCQKHYSEDRGFSIVGDNNRVEWINFMRSNLKSNIDVKTEPNSAMPRSLAARQGMIMELLEKGFFVDPRTGQVDFARVTRYLEMGGVDDMYSDFMMDSDHAKRNIEKLKQGEFVIPQAWYNNEVHIYEVNKFRKSVEYEDLLNEMKTLIDKYADMCTMYMMPPSTTFPPSDGGDTTTPQGQGAMLPAPPGMMGPPPPSVPLQPQIQGTPQGIPGISAMPGVDVEGIKALMSRIEIIKPDLWEEMKKLPAIELVELLTKMLDTINQPQ